MSGGIAVLRSFMNLDWGETGALIAQDVVVSGSALGSILPEIRNLYRLLAKIGLNINSHTNASLLLGFTEVGPSYHIDYTGIMPPPTCVFRPYAISPNCNFRD